MYQHGHEFHLLLSKHEIGLQIYSVHRYALLRGKLRQERGGRRRLVLLPFLSQPVPAG